MALLNALTPVRSGSVLSFAPAASGGDAYRIDDDRAVLLVRNDHTAAWTVTIATPGNVQGLAIDDSVVPVANGTFRAIPLYRQLYRDESTGLVNITYTGVTNLFVAILKF